MKASLKKITVEALVRQIERDALHSRSSYASGYAGGIRIALELLGHISTEESERLAKLIHPPQTKSLSPSGGAVGNDGSTF